jgi:hypothetical protein
LTIIEQNRTGPRCGRAVDATYFNHPFFNHPFLVLSKNP